MSCQLKRSLVVVKLDRLGRSTRDVLNLVHELEQKGAGLRVLEPEFCTSTDTGRILVTVLGMVAEMERRFILERQRVGIDAAKKKGVYKGREPSVPVEAVRKMRNDGKGPAEITAALGVSRMSVWRALKRRYVFCVGLCIAQRTRLAMPEASDRHSARATWQLDMPLLHCRRNFG